MLGLGEIYDKQITEFVADIYYEVFKEYDYQAISNAIKEVVKSHKYNTLPKPADILEFLEGTKDDKALVAWMQINEAIQKGGYYASVEFGDPIISNAIIELGGWQWLCSQEIKDMPFVEKRFMDMYRLLLKRGVSENKKLIGYIEAHNNKKGFIKNIPEPLRIGFQNDKFTPRIVEPMAKLS